MRSKMRQDSDYTMSIATSASAAPLPLFAMPELAAGIKPTTLLVNDSIFCPSTLAQKSLPILEVDSTSSAKGCAPYWNDLCVAISSRLLLPTEIGLLGLDSISLNGWSNITVEQSWFRAELRTVHSKSLYPIFSPSLLSSALELMDCADTVSKSKKIRIYPNKEQQRAIDHWFDVARYVYNQTVEYLRQPETKANWKAIKGNILDSLPDFCANAPYQIKSIAVRDACIAVREAKKRYLKSGVANQVKFRSRKNPVQSCYIPKSAVKDRGIYHTILGPLRYGEQLPDVIRDSRLVRRHGRYYLTVPTTSPRRVAENQGRVVALDPGVRTFQTIFSENSFGGIGIDANLVIQKMCYRLDDLISRMSKASGRRKKSMRCAADRLRRKIIAKVDELHHKVAHFLVDNFDIILLPTFETKPMSSKAKRRIRAKSVRQMLGLSHYRFKMFLQHKAFAAGKIVVAVNEAYTSKTVSWTGEVKTGLGGARVIRDSDGNKLDRDVNGARGIFLRSVVDTPLLRNNLSNHFAAIGNNS